MRDAVFQSSVISGMSGKGGKAETTRAARIQQGRQWARRGWSLWGLSLSKDAICFGVFFTIFEVGREGARKVGLAWDGIVEEERIPTIRKDEAGDEHEYSDDWEGGTRKRRRSFPSLVLQSFLILTSGAVAGLCFALVARPFDRARAAIWEGRSVWAEKDGRLQVIEELALKGTAKGDAVAEAELRKGRRKKSPQARQPSTRRKMVMIQVSRRRGVGRTFVRAKRRNLKAKLLARATAAAIKSPPASTTTSAPSSSPSLASTLRPQPRQPMPSASSLIRLAVRQYGIQFFFAPIPILKRQEARLSSMQSGVSSAGVLQPPVAAPKKVKAGPTRLSARGRAVGQAMQSKGGWRKGVALLAYSESRPFRHGLIARR